MKPNEHLSITERPGTYIVVMSDSRGPIIVVSDGPGARACRYTSEQAAKLSLAVLEAAGVADRRHWNQGVEDGTDVHLEFIAKHLADYIKAQERATAEARELAELEAEAQTLYLSYYSAIDAPCQDWDFLPERDKRRWLAVARRAREMRNEKKVNTND